MTFFARRNKYQNKRVEHAGRSFASKMEAAGFDMFNLLVAAGEIQNLQAQVRVYLFRDPDIYYIADYRFEKDGATRFAEIKGFETPEWKLKKKLWHHVGPAPLDIYMGNYKRLKLVETVFPKGGK